jgi:hypothetical protein
MARAATTSDAFNAVAEARRRQILLFLAHNEHEVGETSRRFLSTSASFAASTWCASAATAATVSIAPTPQPSARCMSSLKRSNDTGRTN